MPRLELRTNDPSITAALTDLIDKNREQLIRASVPDGESQRKLLEINKLVNDLKATDPGLVAAWGAGCGGSCAVQPEMMDLIETLTARRGG